VGSSSERAGGGPCKCVFPQPPPRQWRSICRLAKCTTGEQGRATPPPPPRQAGRAPCARCWLVNGWARRLKNLAALTLRVYPSDTQSVVMDPTVVGCTSLSAAPPLAPGSVPIKQEQTTAADCDCELSLPPADLLRVLSVVLSSLLPYLPSSAQLALTSINTWANLPLPMAFPALAHGMDRVTGERPGLTIIITAYRRSLVCT
jgi:hypothetical protein